MRMSVSVSASVSAMNIHEYYAIIKGKTPSVVSSSSSIQAAQTLEFQPPHSALLTPHSPLPSLPCQERRGPVGSASASAGWVSASPAGSLAGSLWSCLNLSRLFSRLFGVRVAFHVYINKSQRFSRLTYCNLCLVTALYRRKRILITC